MKKNLLILAVTIATLSSVSIAMAFNFQELDSKILSGEITYKQAQKIINKAIKNGELTQEQVKEHMNQIKNTPQENMQSKMFGPPNFNRPDKPDPRFIEKLKKAGITKEELDAAHQRGPDAVKELLDSHGIQPPCRDNQPNFNRPDKPDPEFIEKLKKAGITKEELDAAHQKGPDAMKELLKQHGIEPPQK